MHREEGIETGISLVMLLLFVVVLLWSFAQYINDAPKREAERVADERSWVCSGARDSTGKIDLKKLNDANLYCWSDAYRSGR